MSKKVAGLTYLSQIEPSPLDNRKETFSLLINQDVLKEVTWEANYTNTGQTDKSYLVSINKLYYYYERFDWLFIKLLVNKSIIQVYTQYIMSYGLYVRAGVLNLGYSYPLGVPTRIPYRWYAAGQPFYMIFMVIYLKTSSRGYSRPSIV